MPGHNHGKSIKNPKLYEELRQQGYSKGKSARISNAAANHTLNRKHKGKKGKGK